MLSRRNIRVKIMQLLYAKNRDVELTNSELLQRYQRSVAKSYELYLLNLLQLTKITQISLKDAARRTAKLLPSEEDKQFTAKFFQNDLIQAIVTNDAFNHALGKYQLREKVDEDHPRSLYSEIAKTDYYKSYLKKLDSSNKDHKEILLATYKTCVSNELFNDVMEDYSSNWIDDKSIIVGSMKKTIKGLPHRTDFCELYFPGKETTIDFGEVLLKNVLDKEEELIAIIKPSLNNWDIDRIAIIDLILLKMALCEFMDFSSIPTKVTLNEFVEIAKLYSTDKSKDFINGILDRMMKQLEKDGRIKKEGRGLLG